MDPGFAPTIKYAIGHADAGKIARFGGSVKNAFKVSGVVTVDTAVIKGVKPDNDTAINLEKDSRAEFRKFDIMEGIMTTRNQRGVVISIRDTLLFESGSSELRREAQPLLSADASLMASIGPLCRTLQ